MKKAFAILFLVAGALTVLEFIFISGMFTWLVMAGLVILLGLINIVLEMKERNYMQALLYLLAAVALVMGYWKLA